MSTRDISILVYPPEHFSTFTEQFEDIIDRLENFTDAYYYDFHFTNDPNKHFDLVYLFIPLPSDIPTHVKDCKDIFFLSYDIVLSSYRNFFLLNNKQKYKSLYKKTIQYISNIMVPEENNNEDERAIVPYVTNIYEPTDRDLLLLLLQKVNNIERMIYERS